jgi:transposase-like protein
MAGKKGMTHYPLATKLEVVRLHEEEGCTYSQIAERLALHPTERMMKKWVQRYRNEGEAGLKQKSSGRPRKADTPSERIAQLELENTLLKKLHTELRSIMLARRNIG